MAEMDHDTETYFLLFGHYPGQTPPQTRLLKENEELREALKEMVRRYGFNSCSITQKAKAALAGTTRSKS